MYRGSGFGKILKDGTTIWFNDKFVIEKDVKADVKSFGSLNDYKNIKKGDRWDFAVTIPFPTNAEHYSLSSLNDGESVLFYEHADKDFYYNYYVFYFYDELANIGYLTLTSRELDKPSNYDIPTPIAYIAPSADYNSSALNGKPVVMINGYNFTDIATNVSIDVEPIIKAEGEQRTGYLKRVYKVTDGQIAVKGSLSLRIIAPTEIEYLILASIDGTTQDITLTENGNIYTCFMNIHDNYETTFARGYIDLELPILSMITDIFIVNTPVITQDAGAVYMTQDQGAEIHYEVGYNPTDEGLVAYYYMDDNTTNTTIKDSHSTNDMVAQKNTSLMSSTGLRDIVNTALYFNDGEYATIDSVELPKANESKSISFWFKGVVGGGNDKHYVALATRRTNETPSTEWGYIIIAGATSIGYYHTGEGGYVVSEVNSPDEWIHTIITTSQNGTGICIYKNGVLQTPAINTVAQANAEQDNITTFNRQSTNYGKADYQFVRFYKNKELTQSEITDIYNSELKGFITPPTPTIASPIYTTPLTGLPVGTEVISNATMNGQWSDNAEHTVT